MEIASLTVDTEELERICRKYSIRRLALFGSAARQELGAESDLDILIEFQPASRIGLKFITIRDELSTLFGREVDLNTPAFLSRHFREQVIEEAIPLYEAA